MRQSIGHYAITGTLGEGGMGVVYKARDEKLGRTVAIKMIRGALDEPAARDRLVREARSAASLNHPAICQLYEIGEENGELFLAMELLQGESLATRLTRGPLSLAEAVSTILGVLAGVEALHRHGLIHRDLKPSNIFLTPHGVKLLDFGLALTNDLTADESRLTMPGTVIGTPRYLSPEQILGERIDHRSDVFAAGSVLYEMMTGQPAFDGPTLVKVIHAVAYDHPPGLNGPPAVAAIDRAIHKALAKRPQDRYQSARAMADDLRAAMLRVDSGTVSTAPRPITRLIVPFRMLRPDPEIDFLSFGLADAL